MKILFLLGFRNVFRNKRRTFLTCGVIAIATASLILLDGFMIGMKKTMIKLQTSVFMGEGQIHPIGYKDSDDLLKKIENFVAVEKEIKNNPLIESYSPRFKADGILASSYESQIIRLVGSHFNQEKNVSHLKKSLISGSYPKKREKDSFLVGAKLAHKLKITVGDKVVFSFTGAHDKDMKQEMFRVTGIVQFKSRPIDDLFVFISAEKAQELFSLDKNSFHEVALKFKTIEQANSSDNNLKKKMAKLKNSYEDWTELAKPLKAMLEMTQYSLFIVYSIVFIFILFAILNTIFMSIFERSFEFGVIKALGTNKLQVKFLILSECLSLGAIGSFFGTILGLLVCYSLQKNGVSYDGTEFSGISLSEPIRPIFRHFQWTYLPAIILVLTTLSGVYPAFYTARAKVSDAMRKSL